VNLCFRSGDGECDAYIPLSRSRCGGKGKKERRGSTHLFQETTLKSISRSENLSVVLI